MRADDVGPSVSTASRGRSASLQHAGAHGVVDVVVHVGDEVRDPQHLPLQRRRPLRGVQPDGRAVLPLRMPADAVPHLPAEVQSPPVVFQHVHDPQALLVVPEPARHQLVQHVLAGVPERRVAKVVPERDRLGQLLVQAQHLGDGPGDLRHLQRVRQAGAIVIACRGEEHLRLVLQPPEGLAVDDAVAIVLKGRANVVFQLGAQSPPGSRAARRLRRQHRVLAGFQRLTDARHGWSPGSWCRAPAVQRRSYRRLSAPGRRTSDARRCRRRDARGGRRGAPARARGSDRCSGSWGRCRGRR